jgi:ribosomal protein L7/L12
MKIAPDMMRYSMISDETLDSIYRSAYSVAVETDAYSSEYAWHLNALRAIADAVKTDVETQVCSGCGFIIHGPHACMGKRNRWKLMLTGYDRKIDAIKAVRQIKDIYLKDAVILVENIPTMMLIGDKETLEAKISNLTKFGAHFNIVEVKKNEYI